jgi:dihydroorotate dehydrogenase (NAD+) catalytic subunit
VGDVDLTARVGSLTLPNPVMTASGTAGHADELEAYFPLGDLGAVVVKSLSVDPWPGNAAPRVHQAATGMLNSVGLQGPGLAAWLDRDLPRLNAVGARVVVSIWGQRVDDFARAASVVVDAPGVVAVEVNVSCPNVEDRRRMFAHSPTATAEVVAAVGEQCPNLPRWAKLSPTVADIAEVDAGEHASGYGHRPRDPAAGAGFGRVRWRPVRASRTPGGRAGGVRRPGRPPRRGHHRRRRSDAW